MSELQPVMCEHDSTKLKGYAAMPSGKGPFPAVLVMHSALGIHHMVQDIAQQLAEQGYVAVATDMYGEAADISEPEKAGEHYMAMLAAPEQLRGRTARWYDTVAALPTVDADRVAAIGYCFGGKCVMELARSGRPVKAAVSYHGLLTTHAPAKKGDIAGRVIAWCGARDPFGPPEETAGFRAEMVTADADWQITEFGTVAHGFTDPEAQGGMPGIAYDVIADKTSWAATLLLLRHIFE